MIKPTPIETTKDTEHARSTVVSTGDMFVQTTRGPIHALEAPGSMTLEIHRDGIATTIGLMLYDPDYDPVGDGTGTGMITQFTPDAARTFAASLLRVADRLEPVAKH